MDPVTSQDSSAPDEPPMVIPVEGPPSRPRLPGPNILMAFVWWLVLFLTSQAIGVGALIIIVMIGFAERGAEELSSLVQESGAEGLYDLPGAIPVLFLTGTGGTLLVASLIVAILYRRNSRQAMALRKVSIVHLVLIALTVPPMVLLAGELQSLATKVLPSFNFNGPLYDRLAQQSLAVVLILGCILPALGEELFFRGFLSRGLIANHGVVLGTILASAFFGLMHIEPPQVVGTAALAITFQVAFLSAKSLWAPILLHLLNNATAFTLMRLISDPRSREVLGVDDTSLLPPMLAGAALAAVLVICWLFWETRTRWVLPDRQIWSPGYITAEMPPAHLGAKARLSTPHIVAVIVAIVVYFAFVSVLIWEIRK